MDSLISLRLARLSAILARPVEDITRKVWVDAVKFLTPTQIAAGFDRIEQSFIPTAACPFPVPAQLMAVIEDAHDNQAQIDADNMWSCFLEWMARYYRPDCRDSKYPLLDARILHAANAAGGMEHISSCPIKELAWAKKKFVEAYIRLGKAEQDQPLLASGPVMGQISAIAEGKQLK